MSGRGDPGVVLRMATEADLDFIHTAERLPGYEWLTGRWTLDEHREALRRADVRYLVGAAADGALQGFAIMSPFQDPHEGAKLKRIAVTRAGAGFGRPFLVAVIDWVFRHADVDRFWLDVFTSNARARHVYRSVGMREDGLLRQAYRMPDGSRVDRYVMSVLRSEWPAC